MSRIGIDVSSYQGSIDWKKVLKDEKDIDFAILKVIRKDLSPDKQFENNWSGCTKAGMEIHGVYNYSYATTVAKAKSDAKKVLEILNGRRTKVYLDVEDACQKGLGKLLIDIINEYGQVITSAGLEFGVYTGLSFYNTYIKPYATLKYPLWIAKYGTNTGKLDESIKPNVVGMIGWQYTSKGTVDGISGCVDMNVWYNETTKQPEPSTYTLKDFIKDVQKATGAKVDGIAGPETLSKTVTVSATKNRKHAVVKPLQKYLNALGYNCGTADGIAGPKFTSAVNNYQKIEMRYNDLDGEITAGGKMWKKLLGMK